MIGDWLTHEELQKLEEKRKEFEKQGKAIKDNTTYSPTDFDSYQVLDESLKKKIEESNNLGNIQDLLK